MLAAPGGVAAGPGGVAAGSGGVAAGSGGVAAGSDGVAAAPGQDSASATIWSINVTVLKSPAVKRLRITATATPELMSA